MTPLRRLLSFVLPVWPWVLAAALLGALTVGAGVGLLATSAYLISAAALHPSIAELQVAIVGVRFFGIARGVFRYLERLTSHSTTFRLLGRIRVWFYRAVEPLAPARLAGQRTGDLLGRAIADIETLESFYVRALAPPLVALIVILGMSFFMRVFDPSLAAVLLAFLLLIGLGLASLTLGLGRAPGRTLVESRACLRADLVDGLQGLPDLLAYGGVEGHLTRVQFAEADLQRAQRRMAAIGGLQSALNSLLTNLGVWLVLVLAITLVSAGKLDGVYLAVVILAALASFEAVQGLPQAAQFLESNLQAARRLFEIADAAPAVIDPAAPLALPRDVALSVRGLYFAYPSPLPTVTRSPKSPDFGRLPTTGVVGLQILDDITFDLPTGKRLAILGPSGAGKTTLVNLLLRFWDFDEGEIVLGSEDIRKFQQEDVRGCFSVVSQNTYLFNDTLSANLRLAKPDASDDELARAVEQAQLSAFVASLPQGLATFVGERGLQLSGGERQRLAIARALLRQVSDLPYSPIFIFDEPTANLDTLTERQLIETLQAVTQGRSVLWITHRLVGLEAMDEILVMDAGCILQRGRHAELVEAEGLYRQMWEIQNLHCQIC